MLQQKKLTDSYRHSYFTYPENSGKWIPEEQRTIWTTFFKQKDVKGCCLVTTCWFWLLSQPLARSAVNTITQLEIKRQLNANQSWLLSVK